MSDSNSTSTDYAHTRHGTKELRVQAREQAVEASIRLRSTTKAAKEMGIGRSMMQRLLAEARAEQPGILPETLDKKGWAEVAAAQEGPGEAHLRTSQWPIHAATGIPQFTVPKLPSPLPTAEELLARRRAEFSRVDAAKQARKLIDIRVNIDGPVGLANFGDPHCDDPGTDLALLEQHINIVRQTEGMLATNLGDAGNFWIGRIARLYGEQSTSAAESLILAEWMMKALPWAVVIGGNHDMWLGAGDPIAWMMRQQPGAYEHHGARLNFRFPNEREVRVHARHDFRGHSMWNPAHGVAKAAQMGWRDHILIAGHLHISGYNMLKDPSSGLISHAIRVASYKTHDRYADQLGLPDQNISECVVTIIDPYAQRERQLVTVFMDPEEAADFLKFKRAKFFQNRRVNC